MPKKTFFSQIYIGLLIILFIFNHSILKSQQLNSVPFSTNNEQLTIWNGKDYIPFFVKGVNLGIAKPGTNPGDLEATRQQYQRWFQQIKDAGFNCIRIYTLHYPHFYEELAKYNNNNPQYPLYFFQGVWLNEEAENYTQDLYQMTDTFRVEIEENIDCVHGNKTLQHRYGKAYGPYTVDVSKWNLGYIIGREIYPEEVLTTNENHSNINNFNGTHFSINNASATEVWLTEKLDHLLSYEKTHYQTQRPVSVSSWPTLDPIAHLSEPNRYEDTASVDLSKIQIIDAPGGFFISYHAYPYYPDFVSKDESYITAVDNFGLNSYLGYLTDLKNHYEKFPLIIAEYGVPSSWGIAHYATSGMNHGGFDELLQGETNLRMLHTIKESGAGGGIQFSWMDEWFKRTWITDPIDFQNRHLWHNITAAEQNFGLIKFSKKEEYTPIQISSVADEISNVKAFANYDYFQVEIGLKTPMDLLGECWIGFDTYDATLGESILPNGVQLPVRSEFALHITPHSAQLYVTEAYDLFGIYHKITTDKQLFRSIATDGAPWKLVRWKNNNFDEDVQYIGNLKVNRSFQPSSSKDAITIFDNKIQLKIPWTLLQIVDPSQKQVFHCDDKNIDEKGTRSSDGIMLSMLYKDAIYTTDSRLVWDDWTKIEDSDVIEEFKTSYWTMYDNLKKFNTPAIAFPDSFNLSGGKSSYFISSSEGLLSNDMDIDGKYMSAVLMNEPKYGALQLNFDGSFTYFPRRGFEGIETFHYSVFDGQSLSHPNKVTLRINAGEVEDTAYQPFVSTYPNPAVDYVILESEMVIKTIRIFNSSGVLIQEIKANNLYYKIDLKNYPSGLYFIVSEINGRNFGNKLIIK
jgi:hypothetical protein